MTDAQLLSPASMVVFVVTDLEVTEVKNNFSSCIDRSREKDTVAPGLFRTRQNRVVRLVSQAGDELTRAASTVRSTPVRINPPIASALTPIATLPT